MNLQIRLHYIINWLVFFDVTIRMLSGFATSQSVMPSLGIPLPENFAWRHLHEWTANLFIILWGVHTALYWNWIVNTFKKYLFQPIGKIFSYTSRKDAVV